MFRPILHIPIPPKLAFNSVKGKLKGKQPKKAKKEPSKPCGSKDSSMAAGEGFESPVRNFKPCHLMPPNAAKCCGTTDLRFYYFKCC